VLERILGRDRAGGYAERRHKELRTQWERRMFPRWRVYAVVVTLTLGGLAMLLPQPFKAFALGLVASVLVVWGVVIETFIPDHINRWQRGAFGEQYTAKALKPLRKDGWVIRHDLQTRNGNRDHIVAGGGVYLLETKNLSDSEVTLEGDGLRVRRIDQPTDTYLMDQLTSQMERRARKLWREIRVSTGTSVYIHPVVVLGARFPEQEAYARGVAYVAGDRLAKWLSERPVELEGVRREQAAAWLRGLEDEAASQLAPATRPA
jgi:hypothetical protein